jgi:hypothetical protein
MQRHRAHAPFSVLLPALAALAIAAAGCCTEGDPGPEALGRVEGIGARAGGGGQRSAGGHGCDRPGP